MQDSESQYQALFQRVEEQEKEIKNLKQEVEFLKEENKKLLAELRKYKNENTPPGSIPPFLKPSVTEKSQQERKNESNENRKINLRNSRPKVFDRKRVIFAKRCPCCGGRNITRKQKKYTRVTFRILFPTVERLLNVIHTYYCLDCKKEVTPKLSDALPNSKFDLNTAVLISVLFTAFNLSERNISKMFSTIFSLSISPASISNCLKKLKDYLEDDYKELQEEIRQAAFVHRDETGWRQNGKLNWAWIASTSKTVYININEKRDKKTAETLKLNKNCVQITDGYSAYNKNTKKHQRCWAHLLRKAEKPQYYFRKKEEKQKYEGLVTELTDLYRTAKKDKQTKGCSPDLRKEYENKLAGFLKPPRGRRIKWIGKNAQALKKYVHRFRKHWFTFLEYEYVDSTNNRAERDLRHLVLKRKISQQNRSQPHTESYAMQTSLYKTAEYKGQEYKEVLHNILEDRLTGKI